MQTSGPGVPCRRPSRPLVAALLGASLLGLSPVSAETLQGALAKAYQTNPTLNAARANQMATDENVPIQRAAGLPSAQINSTFNENVLIPGGQFIIIPRSMQTQGQLTVPIYQGGLVKNGIKAADARVAAGEETLRATEASVFSQVVAAYNDVLRDTQIVELNRNNVKNLEVNLRATQDRFEVGDLTRTDVAQSEARLSQAKADLRNAEANLIGSKERYIQQVGDVPADLSSPPPLPGLPADVAEAVEIAIKENPDIAAATRNSEASGFDVKAARAGRLPTLSGFGTVNRNDNFGGAIVPPGFPAQPSSQTSAVIGGRLALPLYQGGRPSAQIRQSQARRTAAMENQIGTERAVIQQVRAAFASWRASLDVIKSAEAAIAANSLSLEGVRAENGVGNRTIIEVLNAEQELINSRVQLATARRNAYVAGFTLLAAMGNAEARDLDLQGITLYNPKDNYRRAKGQFLDWTGRDAPMIRSTRTVTTPAQEAALTVGDQDTSAAAPQ
ncbi:TolC family outer membrane protein [Sandarakinorhabdus sp. AAP62]|uniref:TolC family outer membrane protein n=1 Tax=Sandarakinorhabdus sp. AAP62 TaxID=1248916 RepID=UPI0002F18144|nr:TolC family outer membrane protein [Sandarakinorhabdus sp. AAP62]